MSSGDGDLPNDNPLVPSSDPRVVPVAIQDEMRTSYVTYAMSVIISRALPDVRDGLKPSQRRILVAMNDLSLGPASGRVKCAKICGDTSGNYHPHGEGSVYPTLVRMAQNWNMREVLVDKQGNFGSLAGLPPAAMRYTEARLSALAAEMLDDLKRDTVDYTLTYDQRSREPVVLPSRFPNLLVNGSTGIAVGMATSIPPHNLAEVCEAVTLLIDQPDCTLDELLEVVPGPDFPTGGVICGRLGVRAGYKEGRSTITVRAKTSFLTEKNTEIIEITEIPYLETRDRIREKLEQLVRDDKIKGISRIIDLTDRTLPAWKVRLHVVLKRDADRDVVLNQLFQYSPLQSTFSMIHLALVGNRPQLLTLKELLAEFLRHRVTVIRRRTEYLLGEARKRKHTVEGLLIAQLDIDQVISTIRNSPSRAEAKERLQLIQIPAELIERALGASGFRAFQAEYGEPRESYSLSANQSEAIVSMQLGSLANLERSKLTDEHAKLLADVEGYLELLSDEANMRAVVRADMQALKDKYGNPRRTEINDEELGDYDREALITEESMVVTLSQRGYIKRLPLNTYQAQNRGGKGIIGAKAEEDDALAHLFVASTHAWLMFFTNTGRMFRQKVYDLPIGSRTSKGRAMVNLLALQEGEEVVNCVPVREIDDERFLMFCTRGGVVKKTKISAYNNVRTGGIIAIDLRDDQLVSVILVSPGEDVLLSTAKGMSIRFHESNARAMGRQAGGVRGIRLGAGDVVVGAVIADPELSLLTVCENGYGKRTRFGLGGEAVPAVDPAETNGDETAAVVDDEPTAPETEVAAEEASEESADESDPSNRSYRRQNRGGKGIRDIRTTARNGSVVKIAAVTDGDEILMVTSQGKIQRLRVADINEIGRNTQGVRLMRLTDDKVVSMARIPADLVDSSAPRGDDEADPATV